MEHWKRLKNAAKRNNFPQNGPPVRSHEPSKSRDLRANVKASSDSAQKWVKLERRKGREI
jgi:hypothetical protein